MLQTVIDALEKECSENQNNTYYEAIQSHLIKKCEANSQALEIMGKAITEKKTISGALKKLEEYAKKQAYKGMAMVADDEGFAIIDKYFGLSETNIKPQLHTVSITDLL